jgi:uncharacterized membrane protein YqjE
MKYFIKICLYFILTFLFTLFSSFAIVSLCQGAITWIYTDIYKFTMYKILFLIIVIFMYAGCITIAYENNYFRNNK